MPEDELINDPGLRPLPSEETNESSSPSRPSSSHSETSAGPGGGTAAVVPTSPVRPEQTGPSSGNVTGPGAVQESEKEQNGTVYYNKPVETEAEDSGIGPGYSMGR